MTGSIEAAAHEEVCLLGVSWTPGSQGAAVVAMGNLRSSSKLTAAAKKTGKVPVSILCFFFRENWVGVL